MKRMSFADTAKWSMIEYHSIYPTLGQFGDHMFMCIGNGAEWFEGTLTDSHIAEEAKIAALPAMERLAAAPTRKRHNIPLHIKYSLGLREVPTDIQSRLDNPKIKSCYGFHKEYSRISRIPDDIQSDWLNGIWSYLTNVLDVKMENTTQFSIARNKKEVGYAVKEHKQTIAAAKKILASLHERFPNHKFEHPKITLDPNRQDIDGAKYWPGEFDLIDSQKLIQPFKEALLFAYKLTPKSKEWGVIYPYDTLDDILMQVYEAAVVLGQRIVNDKLQEHYFPPFDEQLFLEDKDPILKVLKQFPKTEDKRSYFGDLIDPFLKMVRTAYRMRRINENKDIPYTGYPLGHDARGGSFEPVDSFSVGQMKYDKEDQDRDALEVIIGKMFSVISEQGCRMVRKAVVDVCDALPPQMTEEQRDARIKKLESELTPEQKKNRKKNRLKIANDILAKLKKVTA